MKYIAFCILLFLPLTAFASTHLAICDGSPHDVIIRNSGSERLVHMEVQRGEVEEFGPYNMITFQLKEKGRDHPEVRVMSPDEELCIWHDEIKVQRFHTTNAFGGPGGAWR